MVCLRFFDDKGEVSIVLNFFVVTVFPGLTSELQLN
jgi:hypothetical protein